MLSFLKSVDYSLLPLAINCSWFCIYLNRFYYWGQRQCIKLLVVSRKSMGILLVIKHVLGCVLVNYLRVVSKVFFLFNVKQILKRFLLALRIINAFQAFICISVTPYFLKISSLLTQINIWNVLKIVWAT